MLTDSLIDVGYLDQALEGSLFIDEFGLSIRFFVSKRNTAKIIQDFCYLQDLKDVTDQLLRENENAKRGNRLSVRRAPSAKRSGGIRLRLTSIATRAVAAKRAEQWRHRSLRSSLDQAIIRPGSPRSSYQSITSVRTMPKAVFHTWRSSTSRHATNLKSRERST